MWSLKFNSISILIHKIWKVRNQFFENGSIPENDDIYIYIYIYCQYGLGITDRLCKMKFGLKLVKF